MFSAKTRRHPTRIRFTPERVVLTLFTLIVVGLIAAPLVEVAVSSARVQTGLLSSTWSGGNYTSLLTSQLLASAGNSLMIALGTAAFATVVGVGLSWLVARTDVPWRPAFEILNLIPFFLSPLIGSIAWTYLADPGTGFINQLARSLGLQGTLFDVYSTGGIIIVLGLFLVPFVLLLTGAAFRQMDSSLEHAAQASGASGWKTAWRITLPLAAPTIISAAILVFVMAIEDLSVPLVLGYGHGIQTLSTRVYDAVQTFPPNYNFGAALGCVMMIVTAGCLYLQRRAMRNRGYVTVSGKGSRAETQRLGAGRWWAFAAELLYLLFAAFLPIAILALIAFSKQWTGRIEFAGFTLDNFRTLFGTGSVAAGAFRNSVLLSAVCATVVVALSVVLVHAIERARIAGRRVFETLVTVPVAVPGLVLGVGLLALLLRTPLFGTLWIIGLAYLVRFLPFAQRSVSAAFLSVSTELEEAASISGASMFRYIVRILMPLVRPGLVAGWLLVFLTFMRELPMSALLQTTDTQTLSVALLNSRAFDAPGVTAAFTLLQAAVLLLAAAIFWTITMRRGGASPDMASGLG